MHSYAAKGGKEGLGRAIGASFRGSEGECGSDSSRKGSSSKSFDEVRWAVENCVKEAKQIVRKSVTGKRPCWDPRAVSCVNGLKGVINGLRKSLPIKVEKTCPIVDKTEEENGEGLKLRSVGNPRTPALALGQPSLPVRVAKGWAMRGGIVGVGSPTAEGN